MSIKNIKPNRGQFSQGYYTPINESKYVGPKPIVFRSSWERKMCMYCDEKSEILKWSSEPIKIKYLSPIDNKVHHYYPDFYMCVKQQDGSEIEYIVEVKPSKQLKKPKEPKRKTKKAVANYKYAAKEYLKNRAKVAAAKEYAIEKGMKFIILTEKTLK
tara:strand:- start:1026 stop:1499 length:474 start_codon:yes stop_codon:yes gene_type:complete